MQDYISVKMLCEGLNDAIEKPFYRLPLSHIPIYNPHTNTLISLSSEEHFRQALALQSKFPVLDIDGTNRWQIEYGTTISLKRSNYQKKEELLERGFTLKKNKHFNLDGQIALPLFEGQLMNLYDHRYKSYEFFTGNKYTRAPSMKPVVDEYKDNPDFENEPRYWIEQSKITIGLEKAEGWAFIGIRDVGRPYGDKRSARAALMPYYPTTGKLPILRLPMDRAGIFLALFNSTVFDFLARAHQPGARISNNYILSQVAVPSPKEVADEIGQVALELSVTSRVLADTYDLPLHPWDPISRPRKIAWLDAMVAKTAYQVTLPEYELILDSFQVLRRAQERELGYYRFKQHCLEAYEQI